MAKWNDKGLTLIGVLVATLIFATILIATLNLSGRSVREIGRSRENFIATNLAREGLELVQFVRDTNMVSGTTEWTGNTKGDALCEGDGERTLITDRQDTIVRILARSGDDNTQLYLDGDTYQHDRTDTVVPYHRQITIDCSARNTPNDEHISISSRVWWESRGADHEVVLRTNLYHWYQ